MMIGERNHIHPTVHIPSWTGFREDPTSDLIPFPFSPTKFGADDYSSLVLQNDAVAAFQRFLPSNDVADGDSDGDGSGLDMPMDAYSCDNFRMFEFKVKKCARARSHDWTDCPYMHPGEKARRRDPRRYNYSGTACPDFRKGNCKKGDGCEYAHGVFECWLHPSRYRTQPCKDGVSCRRRVCFFAHTPEQLRVLSPRNPGGSESYDGSPRRLALEASCSKGYPFLSSPESVSPPVESPPMSPMGNSMSRSLGSNSVSEMVASLRQLQLNKVKSMHLGASGFPSPSLPVSRPGFCSLPSTPTRVMPRGRMGYLDMWDKSGCEEEPVMERVESGRDLRARMFEKLSKENPLDRVDPNPHVASNPDVGWVSDLLQ
ncbi:hypothetical protein RJ640_027353 [Escallonia rubra]|uniref:C3H1-type domain-containing protein n=1 Tax=Escallonia rubra TaxID=112253 RepID=A0AA88U4E0_9ASTE|nr:hypothetical protein RJ640_027353 [Escallonia rubra]